MSYGFEATNNSGQVLISSETRNLHFVEKLSGPRNTTVSATDLDAGIIYSTNINGGIRRWRYTTYCSVTPVPFFTMPTNDFYGILRIIDKGSQRWDIEIFRTGTSSTVPELYIFADARAAYSSNTHGMIVYRDDGTASFDSRVRPLVVNGAVTVTHPSPPRAAVTLGFNPGYAQFCQQAGADQSAYFLPNVANSYSITTTGSFPTKPIFSFLSIAQANVELYSYADQGYNDYSFFGVPYEYNHDYWNSWYWHFYRGGIKQEVTATGLPVMAAEYSPAVPLQTYYPGWIPADHTINDSGFYNGDVFGNWTQPTTRSGDDGLWFFSLPWDIYFTNREGTGVVPYNIFMLSTNGYITFNYYNYSTGSYRDLDASSFKYSELATADTLYAARIMIYASDNSAYRMSTAYIGTSPNRVHWIRYNGYNSSNGWSSYATVAPNLVWELVWYENKPDEMHIVFPNSTISVRAGAVLGVGTAQGWQSIQIQDYAATITPQSLTIKKGRVAADYAANPVVKAGWGSHDFGCHYYFYNNSGPLSGISNNTGVGGTWPYSNETLNLANNAVILADGSKYGQ